MKKITLFVSGLLVVVAAGASAGNMSPEEERKFFIMSQLQQIINNQNYERWQRDKEERSMLMHDKLIIKQWKVARRAGRWKEVEGYEIYLRGRGYNP